VTVIVQLAPAARLGPHVVVWAKLAAPVPVRAIPEIVSAALPVLLSVIVCDPDVVSTVCVPKLSAPLRLSTGAAGGGVVVAVPLSGIECDPPAALSVIVIAAEARARRLRCERDAEGAARTSSEREPAGVRLREVGEVGAGERDARDAERCVAGVRQRHRLRGASGFVSASRRSSAALAPAPPPALPVAVRPRQCR